MRSSRTLAVGLILFASSASADEGVEAAEIIPVSEMMLEELLNLTVVSASRRAEKLSTAPANIVVVTRDMIEKRGYRSLVEICRDLPGFDFATLEDGGGEYTGYGVTRGIGGDPGNSKILVMIDGIVQNFVGAYWSTMWTFEQLLHDVERIEVIQGPGSALYGAQAYAGIIHFITREGFEGFEGSIGYGWQHSTSDAQLYWGHKFDKLHLSVAFRKYDTLGDGGNRYDPGSYFHDNTAQDWVAKDYDADGNFTVLEVADDGTFTNEVVNPYAGQAIPDGFTSWVDSTSVRLKLSTESSQLGAFVYDIAGGSASYLSGLDYYAASNDYMYRRRGYHTYLKNTLKLSDDWVIESIAVYRAVIQMPETGFRYTWRFPELVKRYDNFGGQGYVESTAHYDFDDDHYFTLGTRLMGSIKRPRTITFGDPNRVASDGTQASWDAASSGEGLNVYKETPSTMVYELATYVLANDRWFETLSSAVGARFDYSTEYGTIINPRLAGVYSPMDEITVKLLYGQAFREPSQYEFYDDFRGSKIAGYDLEPEKVHTLEAQIEATVMSRLNLKVNSFYSLMQNKIIQIDDDSMPSGKRFANDSEEDAIVLGGSLAAIARLLDRHALLGSVDLYGNYMFTAGEVDGEYEAMEHVAQHKINGGINWLLFGGYLNINLRMNYVGKTKAPKENVYIERTEEGYAPEYLLTNLAVTVQDLWDDAIALQLVVRNLFNAQYYSLGRENGASDREGYDPHDPAKINPPGFSPPYHPQPKRSFMLRLTLEI